MSNEKMILSACPTNTSTQPEAPESVSMQVPILDSSLPGMKQR